MGGFFICLFREVPTVYAGNFFVTVLGFVHECLRHAVRIQGDETALKNTRERESVPSSRTVRCNVLRRMRLSARYHEHQNKRRSRVAPIDRIASETPPQPATAFKSCSSAVVCRPFGGAENCDAALRLGGAPYKGVPQGGLPPCAGGWIHKAGVPE